MARAFITTLVSRGFAETTNNGSPYQSTDVVSARDLLEAVTTAVAAAQAGGAGDIATEIDAVDTAYQACEDALTVISKGNAASAAVAAAQAIGAGDASAEVDALDTAFQAYEAAVQDLYSSDAAFGDFAIILNQNTVTTKNQIKKLINRFLDQIENSGQFA